MKFLFAAKSLHATGLTIPGEHVGVTLSPGSIGDFRQDCFKPLVGGIKAVLERDRVRDQAEIP